MRKVRQWRKLIDGYAGFPIWFFYRRTLDFTDSAMEITLKHNPPPRQLAQLANVLLWLDKAMAKAVARQNRAMTLRILRDRAFVLVGFWWGLRPYELVDLQVENFSIVPGHGMRYRNNIGEGKGAEEGYQLPALTRFCAVTAMSAWIDCAVLTSGPVFRRIHPLGQISNTTFCASTVIRMLRHIFTHAGMRAPNDFIGHSLRRGFVGWATMGGWNVQLLQDYVGWTEPGSASQFLDGAEQATHGHDEMMMGLCSGSLSKDSISS